MALVVLHPHACTVKTAPDPEHNPTQSFRRPFLLACLPEAVVQRNAAMDSPAKSGALEHRLHLSRLS